MVLGPYPSGGSRSYWEIFTLLDVVSRVDRYAKEVYWPWLERDILHPLVEMSGDIARNARTLE
jgi:hypothetical protein